MSAFEEFGLHPSIICAVEDLDWTLPTPVQAEAVPLILGGGDVCICAETGTGKTAAFGLASLQEIYEQRNKSGVHDDDPGRQNSKNVIPSPYCIVLEPTIPLCEQTCKCMREYSKGPKGVQPDIVVGTPQKIKNSIHRGQLDLSRVFILILDEADDLIKNDQDKILAKLYGIYALDNTIGLPSEEIKLKKPKIAVKIADAYKMDRCMVFCRTNLDCDNLEAYFHSLDGISSNRHVSVEDMMTSTAGYQYSCCVVAGARGRQHNQEALEAFKQGVIRFLICTDVAARGIDISGLPFEIMLTLPPYDDAETYIHRIGRVGRAGHMGLAIGIVAADEVRERVWFHKCNKPRGRGCTDTRLVKDGGCTIWFDEWKTVKEIEKIIKSPIPEVDPNDLSVPELGIQPPPSSSPQEEQRRGHTMEKSGGYGLNPITHKEESSASKRRIMWLDRLAADESRRSSSKVVYGQLMADNNNTPLLNISHHDLILREDTQNEERRVTKMFLETLA
ncbi:ATP-dependent RNA helicase DHH1, putative [Perkinsus marinus ATCC 50983]|uniref:ATP-dependent RNA helicase DHH1, putative n=1 Tax=Perkinsus marinus (strain ATCC 50983 / TXsc) TaxID=423536 RepID=C5K6A8_PERM5|nr:ATP-dependent RNA helicase DHH1, putative [Perkinsus marinus ATCC 50983]EER19828.1 ATP-dependent RNA helicase DHH1, putative [Perkinsus marinus ATCC 50983]|eukprot:XP_002788032.1 ATP-dependent RNA helicase DHH1, putative [Perkinsus marinus ATCC 50983]